MRTTLNINDDLARAAKARAASEGITFTALVEAALRQSLIVGESGEAPIELPTDGSGGVAPGADLSSNRALRDLMDEG